MDLLRVEHAIKSVAESSGVSEESVIEEINHLIMGTYNNILEKGDAEMLYFWEQIPKEGKLPSAYEFIDFLAMFVDKALEVSSDLSWLEKQILDA